MRTSKLLLQAMFILGLIAMTTASVFSKNYSQKTHLSPRAVGVNLPLEMSIWHESAYQKLDLCGGHRVRSNFEITPFYQASTEKHDIGTYFGIGKGNSFKVGLTSDTGKDIDGNYFIHDIDSDSGDAVSPLAGNATFEPKHEVWGVRLDYFQDVGHPFTNLFFRASMPIVYVRNNMGMNISEDNTPVRFGNTSFTLSDFFAGKVAVTQAMSEYSEQSPLTKAKINGGRSRTGLGDLELGIGYKFYQTKKAHVFLSVDLTIPAEERGHGEYLFDAVTGNGNHLGFGVRLDSGVNIWKNDKAAVRALFDLDYHYLFNATEYRTVMPKHALTNGFFSQYYLAGLKGQAGPLFPAANILTQSMRVEPGSLFDMMLALSFKSSGFVIDLGYNLYYKDEEKLWLKDWSDGVYGIAARNYSTSDFFAEEHTVGGFLYEEDLDKSSCITPSQLTNKVFAGLGYQFDIAKRCPSFVGLGGSYEFANDNSALEQYALWLKFGISF